MYENKPRTLLDLKQEIQRVISEHDEQVFENVVKNDIDELLRAEYRVSHLNLNSQWNDKLNRWRY